MDGKEFRGVADKRYGVALTMEVLPAVNWERWGLLTISVFPNAPGIGIGTNIPGWHRRNGREKVFLRNCG